MYFYPSADSKVLKGAVDGWMGPGSWTSTMLGGVDDGLLELLGRAVEDLNTERIFLEERYPNQQFSSNEYRSHGVLHTFSYHEEKMAIYYFMYPNDACRWLWFYHPGNEGSINTLYADLKALQKRSKEVFIYGRNWRSVELLDDRNFVMPMSVDIKFRQEILPQLETQQIHNHALLYSPPGYGKTAYIRRLCKQYQNWTFIIVNPAMLSYPHDIFSVFEFSREYQPAVVFFEDIDVLGQVRGEDSHGMDPWLGALLNCVDGLETYDKTFVMASTNNPLSIDPALRRAGRFGIHIPFRYTKSEIAKIFNQYIDGDWTVDELGFPNDMGPSQIRSVAKTVLGRMATEKIPVSIELIGETTKLIEREGDLLDLSAFKIIADSKAAEFEFKSGSTPYHAMTVPNDPKAVR